MSARDWVHVSWDSVISMYLKWWKLAVRGLSMHIQLLYTESRTCSHMWQLYTHEKSMLPVNIMGGG